MKYTIKEQAKPAREAASANDSPSNEVAEI